MKQPLTPIQKIDEVLKFIASKYPSGGSETYYYKAAITICGEIQRIDSSTEVSEFIMIVQQLLKDGYIDCLQDAASLLTSSWRDLHFYKTFKGEIFSAKGGYEQESKSLDERKRWEDGLLEKGEKNAERLNFYTLILGIATGLLFLIELVKFVYELSCQSHS